ncbi:MAG TPA: ankyrin repeat domain-containing protein [Arcobacter sp.]|nr:ankyrin repeat domain-containing protein [Arcobacter sp.]HIP56100.1 ankyrin repeat domain-containing protein [Arcobacter sp.]
MDELLELIKNGADLNFCDENGKTPLMNISSKNDISMLKVLIQHTHRLDQKDKFNHTALYYAVKANNLESVKVLFQNGAVVSDDIYMLSIHNDFKDITKYFDLQDQDKVFLSKKFN